MDSWWIHDGFMDVHPLKQLIHGHMPWCGMKIPVTEALQGCSRSLMSQYHWFVVLVCCWLEIFIFVGFVEYLLFLPPILVGGFNPSWKILVSWDYYAQYMEKQKMFETTNQILFWQLFPSFCGSPILLAKNSSKLPCFDSLSHQFLTPFFHISLHFLLHVIYVCHVCNHIHRSMFATENPNVLPFSHAFSLKK